MEDGATKIDRAVRTATAIIKLELARRFVPQRPKPNPKGGWWLVSFEKYDQYTFGTFEGLIRDKPHIETAISTWCEVNTDGRVMIDNQSIWFKQLEDATLFWMTFR